MEITLSRVPVLLEISKIGKLHFYPPFRLHLIMEADGSQKEERQCSLMAGSSSA